MFAKSYLARLKLNSSLKNKVYQINYIDSSLSIDFNFLCFYLYYFYLSKLVYQKEVVLAGLEPLHQFSSLVTFPFSLVFVLDYACHHLLERPLHPTPSLHASIFPRFPLFVLFFFLLLLPSTTMGVAFIGGQLPCHPL